MIEIGDNLAITMIVISFIVGVFLLVYVSKKK